MEDIMYVNNSTQSGTTYYIDSTDGDNNNSGTISSPLKSLSALAGKSFSAGDTILLKCGGIYDGTFNAKGSGTKEKPVTISSYGGKDTDNKPVVTVSGENEVLNLTNVDYWTIKNIEITAPDGRGIAVYAKDGYVSEGIEIKDCTFHDIYYHETKTYLCSWCAIYISSSGKGSKINNLTMSGLDVYKCGYGVTMNGITVEWAPELYESPEKSYNQNTLLENSSFRDILQDGVIISSSNNMVVRNCSLINTATAANYPTAALWMNHSNNALVEYCEIAGSTNFYDGMAVDFDGWTTNSTYQYIYSHDNFKFMSNCLYDNVTKNNGNTVRYCLSVNDNGSNTDFSAKVLRESGANINHCANLLWSGSYDYGGTNMREKMTDFKFYNNTIINSSPISFLNLKDALVVNNIFVGVPADNLIGIGNYLDYFQDRNHKNIGKFDGVMTDNCFYGYADTMVAKNTVYKNPLFTSTDFSDKNSFKLSKYSKLLGAGVAVEGDNCTKDFFGNPLTGKPSIGCYSGEGEKAVSKKGIFLSMFNKIVKTVSKVSGLIYTIKQLSA